MKKISQTQYTQFSESGFCEIHGEEMIVTIDGHDIDCVLYEPGFDDNDKWHMIEQETGYLVGRGATQELAAEHAKERLTAEIARLGYDEFRATHFIGRNASPRYGGGKIA